ncbi:MAG: YncE family protein [Prevotella sp.]|nr:YncE family protein [Prevotella sp.]
MRHFVYIICFILLLPLSGCREDELVLPTEYDLLPIPENMEANLARMYLLNEGNMGSNKASIDVVDFRTGIYNRNIYPEKNPTVVKELGDVGNDIQVYRGRLYAVINCSHKVEVMDAATGVRIMQFEIPNCRYIRFYGNYAYVTSYVAPVLIDPAAPQGAVYRIDLRTNRIVSKAVVGFQPEELEIRDGLIFVANSGGYRAPNYDNTISIIDINRYKQVAQIPVAINLHRLKIDKNGKIWVSSRGDYKSIGSNLYVLKKTDKSPWSYEVEKTMNIPCTNMALKGDSLYVYSVEFNFETQKNTVTYGIIDVNKKELVSSNFITDGTENEITVPYGIAIHPVTSEIFVTDAKNYVSSGVLHCYSPDGKKKWSVRTGDIPAHMAFYNVTEESE